MRSKSSWPTVEAFWEAYSTRSSFVLGYCIPDNTFSTSAAEGALGGCAVAICLSSRDFCSNPSPHTLQVNWELVDDDILPKPKPSIFLCCYYYSIIKFLQVLLVHLS